MRCETKNDFLIISINKGRAMKKRIVILIPAMFLLLSVQGCWASDVESQNGKVEKSATSAFAEEDSTGPYAFDRLYEEMWKTMGFSETDKQVCHELATVLNELYPEPMICLMSFPEDSPFKNLQWSAVEKTKALELEKMRMGRSQGPQCGAASAGISLEKNQKEKINSGDIVYEKTTADIDNDGNDDILFKKVWTDRYCNKEKEHVAPMGVRLIYGCVDEKHNLVDLKEITSLDVFEYKGKNYLFSWHGAKPPKGFVNVNEYVPVRIGSTISRSVRQICRINYKWEKE